VSAPARGLFQADLCPSMITFLPILIAVDASLITGLLPFFEQDQYITG
jgi:hypothetical protein